MQQSPKYICRLKSFVIFLGLGATDEPTHDSVSLSWNDFENLDGSQFKEYIILVKKITADLNDTELPREISSLASAYTIHGLGEFTEYEISVLIDSVDFGQSEWSDSVIIKTKEKSESDFNELDQLKTQIVRFFIYKTYQGMNIQISFMWHILVKNPVLSST